MPALSILRLAEYFYDNPVPKGCFKCFIIHAENSEHLTHSETQNNLISIIPTSFLARSYLNQYQLTNSLRRLNLKATLKGAKVGIYIKV